MKRLGHVVIASLLSAGLPAQEILWEATGVADDYWLGGPVVFLGDVDGDGYDEAACLARAYLAPGFETRVMVLSGRDGSVLRYWAAPSIPTFVAAGDADGDGIGDYAIVTNVTVLAVEVRSGRDDSLLWQVPSPGLLTLFGSVMVGDLDLDGDGRPDLVIGAATSPTVYAYANGGRLLYVIDPPPPNLGSMRGDLDGDGWDDFLVGLPSGAGGRGTSTVYSGRTGRPLVMGLGQLPGDGLGGAHNLGCGDVDGDGVLDWAASNSGRLMPGLVRVFSGHDGHAIHTWRRPFDSFFGQALATEDLDLDGVHDLLVGTVLCEGNDNGLEWHSLRDGGFVGRICRGLPTVTQSSFGSQVVTGPPQPGSPFPTIAVVDPSWMRTTVALPAVGKLSLFRSVPAGVQVLSSACQGTLPRPPRLGFTHQQAHGGIVRLHLSDAPPAAPAFLLLGLSSTRWGGVSLPLALDPFGFPGCSLYTSIELALGVTTGTAGIRSGYAAFDLPFPYAGGLIDVRFHGQWVVAGSGSTAPGALTGALSWTH